MSATTPLRDRLRALLDAEHERDDGTYFGVLYREAGAEPFARTGLAPPGAMLGMWATTVEVSMQVARETGEDEEAVRAAMARIAMGRCPECGAPLEECTVR